uniref:Syntaxin binding protein 6 n=1 Tax=Laticauda laticaudata TaxID=8630 RepID=A0A8C5RCJ9_LATLA
MQFSKTFAMLLHNPFYFMFTVTNKRPAQAYITKVKQFEGSTSFVRRSQWMLEQLRQVNGLDPHRDSPEFDLLFENAFDQWVASTASEKCTFFQILHHTCQRYLTDKKPEFINCQSKVIGGTLLWEFVSSSPAIAMKDNRVTLGQSLSLSSAHFIRFFGEKIGGKKYVIYSMFATLSYFGK